MPIKVTKITANQKLTTEVLKNDNSTTNENYDMKKDNFASRFRYDSGVTCLGKNILIAL